jgi:hypothetical protein
MGAPQVVSTLNFVKFVEENRVPMNQIQELISNCFNSGEKFAQMEIVVCGQKRLIRAIRGLPAGEILLTMDRDYN